MSRSCLSRYVSLVAALVLLIAPLAGFSEQPRSSAKLVGADAQLKRVLEKIEQSQPHTALAEVDRLIARYPNFRLAHLVRGDLLLARAKPISGFGNTGHAARERLDELRAEAFARMRAYNDHPPTDLIPRYLLRFNPMQKHAVVVDSRRSRVYVYENANGTPRLVEDYYTTFGKRVQVGITPVIIAEHVEWLAPAAWRAERDAFMAQLEAWRTSWESRDTGRYLAHYAREFRSDGMDISAWNAHKQRVNAAKTWIKVSLKNVSVFRFPGKPQ